MKVMDHGIKNYNGMSIKNVTISYVKIKSNILKGWRYLKGFQNFSPIYRKHDQKRFGITLPSWTYGRTDDFGNCKIRL